MTKDSKRTNRNNLFGAGFIPLEEYMEVNVFTLKENNGNQVHRVDKQTKSRFH